MTDDNDLDLIIKANEFQAVPCPVCGAKIVIHPLPCFNCGWELDAFQEAHPDEGGCTNCMSLNEAREAYRKGKKVY